MRRSLGAFAAVPAVLVMVLGFGTAAQASPAAGSTGSALPNTGGPAFWILIVAIVLIVGGVVALVRSRRRAGGRTD